jgi:hypothetical protein
MGSETKKHKCNIQSEWQCISPEVTVTGFKKCCISSAMDGTNGDMLWDVRSECEGAEGGTDGDMLWDVRSVRELKVGQMVICCGMFGGV